MITTVSSAARSLRAGTDMPTRTRPHAARLRWYDLAACTLLPTLHGMSFQEPFRRLGNVVLVVLRHQPRRGGQAVRSILRGYHAHLRDDGVTCWDAANCMFSAEMTGRRAPRPRGLPRTIAGSRVLPRLAQDLFFACVHVTYQDAPPADQPQLPATLVALPRWYRVAATPTALVQGHAQRCGIHWRQAWRELAQQLDQRDPKSRCGRRLIDSRLIAKRPAAALEELHLVTPLLGRALRNPVIKLPPGTTVTPAMLRDRLCRAQVNGCTDADLEAAIRQPHQPLIASRMARLQVWRPVPADEPDDPFCFTAPGIATDLRPAT